MSRWMCVLGLGAALSGACGTTVNVEQERTALTARDRQWSESTKDIDKFMTFFSTDAVMYPPGEPAVRGADAIRKGVSAMMAPGFALSWTPSSASVAGSGDIGYTAGSYTMTMGGSTEKGKYVTVWTRPGGTGDWKVSEDIFNSDAAPAGQHVMVAPNTIKWGDFAALAASGREVRGDFGGDPSQAAPFVIRAQVPAGYRVPPHWHPTSENLTVLSGTVALGMGEKWDDAALSNLAVGGYSSLPADMRHFFLARTAATFQVHGTGPFAVTYVNPADDPRNKK